VPRLLIRIPWNDPRLALALGALIILAAYAIGYDSGARARLFFETSQGPALALVVTRQGDLLRLSWDREGVAVRHADGARLSIVDGDRRQRIALTAAQLRQGSISYLPLTADVSFRMEVLGTGVPPAGESARIVGPFAPSAAPLPAAVLPAEKPKKISGRRKPALPREPVVRTRALKSRSAPSRARRTVARTLDERTPTDRIDPLSQ
jgi:hypothetical protein